MATRNDMMEWIVSCLRNLGGKGWPKEVSKCIWENYEDELRSSGDLLYSWQYDVRWAAQKLRNTGVLKPVHGRKDLPWELVD